MNVAEKQQLIGAAPPIALTIAGSDCSGGAGMQADLKTFAALGVFGASAITAATAQNTSAVSDVRVFDAAFVERQIRACFEDLPVAAVKTGMLANADITSTVAEVLHDLLRSADNPVMLVVDPVMIATSGASLLDDEAVSTLVDELLPLATLVTPNLPEAAALTGRSPDTDPETLGGLLLESGVGAVLIKGGHAKGRLCRDLLVARGASRSFEWPRLVGDYHGTGCAYAAAIAALGARGWPLEDAVEQAGRWLHKQIGAAFRPLHGCLGVLPFTPEEISKDR